VYDDSEEEVDFIIIDGQSKIMNVVDFGGVIGQTVRISLSSGILSLAEVQVEGVVHTPAPTVSPAPTTSPAPTMTHPGASGYALEVEDSKNYLLAYSLDIPDRADFDAPAGVPYSEDFSDEGAMPLPGVGFNRVAYYLELEKDGVVEWVWVSFDAFTNDIKKIGVPTFASGAIFQEEVTNMNVVSSLASLNGEGLTGNIEFWPNNYGTKNSKGVPGASGSLYDFGDERVSSGNYGSMQVHSSELGSTVFAINRWNRNEAVDIGIGNKSSGHPDWTFSVNGGTYSTKRLEVLVR
jgi:sialate O-acetylesterase